MFSKELYFISDHEPPPSGAGAATTPDPAPPRLTRDALRPFAEIGAWLFARPDVSDAESLVDVALLNGVGCHLTRGDFKAAYTAYHASETPEPAIVSPAPEPTITMDPAGRLPDTQKKAGAEPSGSGLSATQQDPSSRVPAGWSDGVLYCYGGCGRHDADIECDMLLPTALWNRIAVGAPFDETQEKIEREGRGGTLCPACIVTRLAALPDCTAIFADIVDHRPAIVSPASEKVDIDKELHAVFTRHGIASYQLPSLVTDIIRWAAQACRQSQPIVSPAEERATAEPADRDDTTAGFWKRREPSPGSERAAERETTDDEPCQRCGLTLANCDCPSEEPIDIERRRRIVAEARADTLQEQLTEQREKRDEAKAARAWQDGAIEAGHMQPMIATPQARFAKYGLQVDAYERGHSFIHNSDVAKEMARRIDVIAKRASEDEGQLLEAKTTITQLQLDGSWRTDIGMRRASADSRGAGHPPAATRDVATCSAVGATNDRVA